MRLGLVLALAVLLTPLAAAQTSFGVRAGLNVATLANLDEVVGGADQSPRLGATAGVYAQQAFSPSLAARLEVLYSQQGTRLAERFVTVKAGGAAELDVDVDYVLLPVLARVAVPLSPTLDAGVLLGPQVGLKVSEEVRFDGTPSTGGEDAFKTLDVGVALGAEVGSGPFAVDLRYALGLTQTLDDADTDDPTVRNGVFSTTFVYRPGR